MARLTKILDCLQGDARGVIIICNIVDGLRAGLYNARFVKRVLVKWTTYHSSRVRFERLKRRPWDADELLKSIEAYHGSRPLPAWWTGASSVDLELRCTGPLPRGGPQRYGSSRSTEQVFEAFSDASAATMRGRLIFPGSASRYFDDDDVIEQIRALPDADRQFTLKTSASMPKYGRMFWFTQESMIMPACRGPAPANAVRDLLGLVHYESDFAATAVFFGGAEARLVKNGRPTFGDAATHRRFMVRASLPKNRRRKAWGFTANLEQIALGTPNYDGVVERVASPFKGTTHGAAVLTMLPLGKTSGKRGVTAKDDDSAFAKLLRRTRNLTSLRKTLARQGIK